MRKKRVKILKKLCVDHPEIAKIKHRTIKGRKMAFIANWRAIKRNYLRWVSRGRNGDLVKYLAGER